VPDARSRAHLALSPKGVCNVVIFLTALISGIGVGLLYGLLAFAVVLLYKSTGVANFAQGNIATLGAFFVWALVVRDFKLPLYAGIAVGFVLTAIVGMLMYLVIMRPRDRAGELNLAARTLATYLLIFAIINDVWGAGQPFSFPNVFPTGSIKPGGVYIPWATVGILAVAIVLTAFFWAFFRYSSVGLLLRGLAENPQIARMLGARTQLLATVAWAVAAGVSVIVGVLVAPGAELSSGMMDQYLVFAFVGAIIGGITTLPGAYVGGIAVGVISSIATQYGNVSLPSVLVFGVLLLVLFVRPYGIFGKPTLERL
jgi:branched-chain amino acid transport system permease protein